MSDTTADRPRPARARPTVGAYLWFAGMAGMWIAFGAAALASPGTLGDVWNWIRELPLGVELLVWLLAFPGVLGLAVWESSWAEPLRVSLVVLFALGWTVVSIPRPRRRAGRIHYEVRRGQPHDFEVTRTGLRDVGSG